MADHVIEDLWGIRLELLNDAELLKILLEIAATNVGLSVIQSMCNQSYDKIVALVMTNNAHIAIHAYPDKGFAALDCYIHGGANPNKVTRYIKDMLRPKKVYQRLLYRGNENGITGG